MSISFNMKFNFLTFLALLISHSVIGQGFKGTAVLGANFAQLDGDRLVGYRKVGLQTGLKVSFDLSEKLSGNVELLYSQVGSSSRLFAPENEAITKLNYMVLPLYISINDWYIEKDDYHKLSGQVGISLGYLISSSVNAQDYSDEWFNKQDVSWLAGANYAFTKNISVTLRYTRSFNKLLNDPALFDRYLLGYFWSIRTEYTF